MKTLKLFISISVLALSLTLGVAKGQVGVPFRVVNKSTFPQAWGIDTHLNGLQILSRPLPGEPFSLFDFTFTSPINENSENFKLLLDVFPGYKISNRNISEVDKLIAHTGQSQAESWSHHAMPLDYGGIAFRYLAQVSQENLKWIDLFHEYEKHPPEFLIENGDIRTLSPIEKYEYLVGNTNFSITQFEWLEGNMYFEKFGHIPHWIGLCHGTAPATLNSPRPINAISLKSYDGKHNILFYPSDIKELVSYAWGNNANESAMIGMRCGSVVYYGQRPSLDCLDPNPGSFHLAVLNLMGLNAQTFIVDTSAGNEVWNRSIKSYRFKYFKPGTHNFTDKLEHAITSIDDYKNDPFAKYRSSRTASIVGVWMELSYIIGTRPSNSLVDSPERDLLGTHSLWYDIEIDQDGNIIGGEWQNEHHPDFLWVVGDNIKPRSLYDFIIGNNLNAYDGTTSLPPMITSYAKKAALKNQLLFSVLERMLELSRK